MRIFHKLLLATSLPVLVVLGLAAVFTYLDLQRGFAAYVAELEAARLDPAVQRLADIHRREGGFDALIADPRRWGQVLSREGPRPPGPPSAPAPPTETKRSIDPLELPPRVTLYDAARRPLHGRGEFAGDSVHRPIDVDGVRVGYLGVRPIADLERTLELDYLQDRRTSLLVILAAAMSLALALAYALTRGLAAPIVALADGARRLAAGDYDARIAPRSRDELGALAHDFNDLARTLRAAEESRRDWVADTSHELRTPVTVLRGEIEAMQDGVRPLDAAALASLHAEVVHLGQLVDDLALLARADRGDLDLAPAPLDLRALVSRTLDRHRPRLEAAGLSLTVDIPDAPVPILGDALRLEQLLTNLIENSRRYTHPGGPVRIRLTADPRSAHLVVEDGPPGVPDDALPRLFDRFYRPDAARSRAAGGAGLGLSICARIAQAHGGVLTAEASSLGGLALRLQLPLRG